MKLVSVKDQIEFVKKTVVLHEINVQYTSDIGTYRVRFTVYDEIRSLLKS